MFHMSNISKHFGKGSLFVIAITFILFVVALFVKGFTHDLLIEVAIFLVSVKLILMAYSNSVSSKKLEKKLLDIEDKIEQLLEKEK
ncbi:hypothetical protein [Sulfurimonas sp.]